MAEPRLRALVVDDDPLIQGLLAAFLEDRGYACELAADGREALQRLVRTPFNLVITDRNMPEMDGLALARAIRATPAESYVYCIMLTSSADEATLVAAMQAGVDDFIGKPLNPAELGARLNAAERVLALEARLASRNRELADALGQLNKELELARSLQLGQLPAPAAIGRLRFDWLFEASSYVGGDMFDFFRLDEHHVAFYVADVSGHGVAAAMLAFNARHQLLACAQSVASGGRWGMDPAALAGAIVADYNRRMLQILDTSHYLTLAFGVCELAGDEGALVLAGHPRALLAPAAGAAFEPVGEPGLPIGILEEAGHTAQPIVLGAGARLLLYSDGVTECSNAAGDLFGDARLREHLAGPGSMAAHCAALRTALRGWRGGPFEDDVTALALELH